MFKDYWKERAIKAEYKLKICREQYNNAAWWEDKDDPRWDDYSTSVSTPSYIEYSSYFKHAVLKHGGLRLLANCTYEVYGSTGHVLLSIPLNPQGPPEVVGDYINVTLISDEPVLAQRTGLMNYYRVYDSEGYALFTMHNSANSPHFRALRSIERGTFYSVTGFTVELWNA